MSNTLPITVTGTYTLFLPLSVYFMCPLRQSSKLSLIQMVWVHTRFDGAKLAALRSTSCRKPRPRTLPACRKCTTERLRHTQSLVGVQLATTTGYEVAIEVGLPNGLHRNYTDVLWEAEPNNFYTQANGPLVSGLTYKGQFDSNTDFNDYFVFELAAAHNIEVWLTNIASGENYDLILRNDAWPDSGRLLRAAREFR